MIDTWKLYKDMCRSLQESGCSTEGMYVAYLKGELRRARQRIKELESKA